MDSKTPAKKPKKAEDLKPLLNDEEVAAAKDQLASS